MRIDDSVFQNFKTCGALIANQLYPNPEIIRNLQIDSSEFADDLNISFDKDSYSEILSELADIQEQKEVDFEGFSQCEMDEFADPIYEKCFNIEVTNSEFVQLNNNLNEMKTTFGRTGQDLGDSIVPQFLGYFIALHQYKGSLLINYNRFL